MDLSSLTDIHAHVLPALDDGPPDLAESSALLQQMRASGVQRVFCTSHYGSLHFPVPRDSMRAAYDIVQQIRADSAQDAGDAYPQLALGAEVRLMPALVEDIRRSDVPTLGETSYVLVEFPGNEISSQALQWVHELKVRGYRPIMAHPERNVAVQKQPGLVEQLLEAGLLLQLTANCFVQPDAREQGASDERFQRVSHQFAWNLLQRGKATFIASDAHGTTIRPPLLRQAYEAIAQRLGTTVVEHLIANADAVWHGGTCTPVPAPTTAPVPRRRRWFSGRR